MAFISRLGRLSVGGEVSIVFSPKAYRVSRSEELWLGRQNAPRTQAASKKLLEEPSQARGSKMGLGRHEKLEPGSG